MPFIKSIDFGFRLLHFLSLDIMLCSLTFNVSNLSHIAFNYLFFFLPGNNTIPTRNRCIFLKEHLFKLPYEARKYTSTLTVSRSITSCKHSYDSCTAHL